MKGHDKTLKILLRARKELARTSVPESLVRNIYLLQERAQFDDNRHEQCVLAGKVVVDCPLGDVRGSGDLIHTCPAKSMLLKFADRRRQNGRAFAIGTPCFLGVFAHLKILLEKLHSRVYFSQTRYYTTRCSLLWSYAGVKPSCFQSMSRNSAELNHGYSSNYRS